MDLGFGAKNNEIGQATAQALMHGAQEQVKGIESEMAQYDRLLDDEVSLSGWGYRIVGDPNYHCLIATFSHCLAYFFFATRMPSRTSEKSASSK